MDFTTSHWPPRDGGRQPFQLLLQTSMLDYAIERYHARHGVTLHPVLGDVLGSTLYAVSVGTSEVRPESGLTREALLSFICANSELFACPGACLGLWQNAFGHVELDVTVVLKSRKRALRIANAQNQRAIFNLRTGEQITVRASARSSEIQ